MQQTVRKFDYDAYAPVRAPRTRTVRKPNLAKKRRQKRQKLVKITLLSVCFIMAFSVVLGYASIAQLNQNLAAINEDIAELERANQQAQAQLEYELDLTKIEAYAKDTLGMNRPASYQIVRLNMAKEDKGEVIEEKKTGIGTKIGGFFKTVVAYLQ